MLLHKGSAELPERQQLSVKDQARKNLRGEGGGRRGGRDRAAGQGRSGENERARGGRERGARVSGEGSGGASWRGGGGSELGPEAVNVSA